MEHDSRPWEEYWVLEDAPTQGQKNFGKSWRNDSLQYHKFRSEVWTIVDGMRTVSLDGIMRDFHPVDIVQIRQGSLHRSENKTDKPLTLIEVQYGTYFEEDDIVRLEDNYNRI